MKSGAPRAALLSTLIGFVAFVGFMAFHEASGRGAETSGRRKDEPTITTDRALYAPGRTAILRGVGFPANDQVSIRVGGPNGERSFMTDEQRTKETQGNKRYLAACK